MNKTQERNSAEKSSNIILLCAMRNHKRINVIITQSKIRDDTRNVQVLNVNSNI